MYINILSHTCMQFLSQYHRFKCTWAIYIFVHTGTETYLLVTSISTWIYPFFLTFEQPQWTYPQLQGSAWLSAGWEITGRGQQHLTQDWQKVLERVGNQGFADQNTAQEAGSQFHSDLSVHSSPKVMEAELNTVPGKAGMFVSTSEGKKTFPPPTQHFLPYLHKTCLALQGVLFVCLLRKQLN